MECAVIGLKFRIQLMVALGRQVSAGTQAHKVQLLDSIYVCD